MSVVSAQPAAGVRQPFVARSRAGDLWRRFWRSRRAVVGAAVILLVVLAAVFANLLAPASPDGLNLAAARQPPLFVDASGRTYLLGSDALGRDILSRILYGARVSLTVGLTAVLLAGAIGVPIGLVAGYFGGKLDAVVMRLADVQLAIPGLLLAIALVAVVGGSVGAIIAILAFTGWVGYARIVRGQVLSLKQQPFVESARCIGVTDGRVIVRHILPNVWTPVIVLATSHVGGVIIAESSLTFLGIGVPRNTPTWGTMIADGRGYMETGWWIATFPGLVLTLTVLAIYFFGDGLRDVLDPRLRL
jgi:peptide/nickel transport system permease protein